MKKCPECNRVYISDHDERCINCGIKKDIEEGVISIANPCELRHESERNRSST